MKKIHFLSLITALALCLTTACGGEEANTADENNDEADDGAGTTGLQISSSFDGLGQQGLMAALTSPPKAASFNDDANLCPDETGGGVSANITPSEYIVALKRFTLLGDSDSGTEDYDVFSADSVAEAYLANSDETEAFFSSESLPPAGSYSGIEIEVFYIEMYLPMIIPALSEMEANYRTRGYFTAVGSIEPRDVTFYDDNETDDDESDDTESWINRQTDTDNPYELVSVTDEHPFQVLDLWSDDDFWGRDPVTISTEDELGTDFSFTMSDDSLGLMIPDAAEGIYEITMGFDVTDRFTFWEYLENGGAADADGSFTVGYDCGYRILFPNVLFEIDAP